jgi:adenine-specific DNA-methyltransferase
MSNDVPEKISIQTDPPSQPLLEKFSNLFPGVIQDGVVDVARLGEVLGLPTSGNADTKERFGLMWAGKAKAVEALQAPSRASLAPDLENSIDFETAQNVFIEGDNLEVLKLLQKSYNDKIKMIYIDPPYNTGNDFVYNDDFSDRIKHYLDASGQTDAEGNRLRAGTENSGRRHSRWLTMMYSRLSLMRNLLTDDGLLLISIDENELHHLTSLVDEIYGEENRIGHFYWKKRSTGGQVAQNALVRQVEIVIAVARDINKVRIYQLPNENAGSIKWRDFRKSGGQWQRNYRPNQFFPVYVNKTDLSVSLEKFTGAVEVFPQDGNGVDGFWENGRPTTALRIEKSELRGKLSGGKWKIEQLSIANETVAVGTHIDIASSRGGEDLKKLLGESLFDNPKPVDLIKHLVQIGSADGDIVADFFAGSGTTGEAVLASNVNGELRRFLLVNAPEEASEKSVAKASGIEFVSDLTIRRLTAATKQYDSGGSQGLRTLRLADSSFVSEVLPESDLPLLNVFTLRKDAKNDEIASEVFLKQGVSLDEPWVKKKYGKAAVVQSGRVSVVLAKEITDEVVDAAIADDSVSTIVFLEDGFAGRDAVKANAHFSFKQKNKTMKTV